jgi:DUF4097 and DUF4098 domain-containing protein YvlB
MLAIVLAASTLIVAPITWHVVSAGTADTVTAESAEAERDAQSRQDRETRVLALGPTGSLELKTVSGNVTVSAGNDKDVHIEIVRESRGRTAEEAQAGLDAVKVKIDHQGERATVSVEYPQDQQNFHVNVSYTVSAPAGTRVSATSVSGNVSVRDIKGDVAAVTVSGDATAAGTGVTTTVKSISGAVSATDVTGSGNLTATSVSGNVVLDRIAARRMDANSVSGNITARSISADQASLQSVSGTIDYSGTIARAGHYDLQSHSGNVRLVASGSGGFELQATTFSGQIRPGPELALKNVSQTSRSLRGTVGDGSAVVSASTFSGNVAIGGR